mgnify:CR=1 FL=1
MYTFTPIFWPDALDPLPLPKNIYAHIGRYLEVSLLGPGRTNKLKGVLALHVPLRTACMLDFLRRAHLEFSLLSALSRFNIVDTPEAPARQKKSLLHKRQADQFFDPYRSIQNARVLSLRRLKNLSLPLPFSQRVFRRRGLLAIFVIKH